MKHHILNYMKRYGQTVIPNGDELIAQLNNIDDLAPGDKLQMQDGTLFGYMVEQLTDFTEELTLEAACEIIEHEPNLSLYRKTGRERVFVTHVYADRRAVKADGTSIYQVLKKAFGEPAWVNYDDSYVCYTREKYVKA